MSDHLFSSYSLQFNSDPRSLDYIRNKFMSNDANNGATHPYIVAQRKKQSNHNSARYQCIPSKSTSSSSRSIPNASRTRKRKFIETFEDDEQGQYEYHQSMIVTPSKKQHITSQTVMKSISMVQRTASNKNNGKEGSIQLTKPSNQSWQQLIQTYYKNGKHCDVLHFTQMEHTKDAQPHMNNDMDCEMKDKKPKRRPIRLNPSCTKPFTNDGFINSEELKRIANQCYVSTVTANHHKNGVKDHEDKADMDCD
eukprot:65295_1